MTMKRLLSTRLVGLAGLVLALAACDSQEDDFKRKNAGPDPNDPSVPKCTETGKPWVGFAGTKLEEKRSNAPIGADRARIKPYSALKGEYERAIGVAPAGLEGAAATFGSPPDRFSSEPRASAIQVYSAFRVSFEGCLAYVETIPAMASAPTPESAAAECRMMARKFWSRAATDEELKACTDVAVTDSAPEGAPRRRWAYTCATLLSASGFLTY